jgi:internalin A
MSEMALRLIAQAKKVRSKTLDLGNCGIVGQVPDEVGELAYLEELILSSGRWDPNTRSRLVSKNAGSQNRINLLPTRLPPNLKVLIAADTMISEIQCVFDLLDLTILNLQNTEVVSLDPLQGLSNLQTLLLSGTKVKDLNPIAELDELTMLFLTGTSIESFDPLANLIKLSELRLSGTNIKDLSSLSRLARLQNLHLMNTAVSDTGHLKGLTELRTLYLSGTSVKDIGPLQKLSVLRTLDLSQTEIADIFPLRGLKELRGLHLSHTKVVDVRAVKELFQLQILDLDGTSVTDISPLRGLVELRALKLRSTLISDISDVQGLTKLLRLDLGDTKVEDIHPLLRLTNLQELWLWNTKVADISPLSSLAASHSFTRLDLDGSLCHDLSVLLPMIERGIEVNLGGKEGISVKDCPLSSPPIEIVQQGREAILAYWQQRETEGIYINRDVKLILIGNSDAGKTALRIYLETGKNSDSHASTHGMKITTKKPNFKLDRLKLHDASDGSFVMRIFDFGGQEYYHDTHHLFFTTNTAYIVLWTIKGNVFNQIEVDQKLPHKKTSEKVILQNAPLPYWLDAIQHFCTAKMQPSIDGETVKQEEDPQSENELKPAEKPPSKSALQKKSEAIITSPAHVLVIQNKIDEDGLNFIAEGEFKQNFPMIYDFGAIALSPKKPMRLNILKEQLKEMLEQMPIVGAEFPISTKYIKERLDNFQEDGWEKTKPEFLKWANQVVKDATKQKKNYLSEGWIDVLIPYFAQIGLLLHFPKAQNPPLKDKVFLRPDKVTERIYMILDDLTKQDGKFDRAHVGRKLGRTEQQIADYLRNPNTDKEAETMLALMRQFKIIFLEGGDPNRFVAPLYLPKQPFKGVKLFLGLFQKPAFRIEYKGFIHKSVILHFFEEFGPMAYKETVTQRDDLYYYWREGIVVRHKEREVMVLIKFHFGEEDEQKPGTYHPAHVDLIPLAEQHDHAFLQEILATIEGINNEWEATVTVTANGTDFVPLQVVRKAAEDRSFTFVHAEKAYQLIDFREHTTLKMPMKKLFISYSKADRRYLNHLEAHLSTFKRNGLIATWHDRKLIPGEPWDQKIREELETADITIFLISPDFLNTDYIWDIEIQKATARADVGKTRIVPIVVRPCVWKDTPLHKYYVPNKAAVISAAQDPDAAWTIVVEALEKVLRG